MVVRWRTLCAAKNHEIVEGDFDRINKIAVELLEVEFVAKWVCEKYPIILVDEAQDLNSIKLELIKKLSIYSQIVLAADGFQCLDENIQPAPAISWMNEHAKLTLLSKVHRTDDESLLVAANEIRSKKGKLTRGKNFKTHETKFSNMVPWYIVNELRTNRWESVAIISPARSANVLKFVQRVSEKPIGKVPIGPYRVRTEESDTSRLEELEAQVDFSLLEDTHKFEIYLKSSENTQLISLGSWVEKCRKLSSIQITEEEIQSRLKEIIRNTKRFRTSEEKGIVFTTAHGAKNREFDGVIVIWPYATPPSDDQKKRLLYNAVTRAKKWCVVIPENKNLLNAPPFV